MKADSISATQNLAKHKCMQDSAPSTSNGAVSTISDLALQPNSRYSSRIKNFKIMKTRRIVHKAMERINKRETETNRNNKLLKEIVKDNLKRKMNQEPHQIQDLRKRKQTDKNAGNNPLKLTDRFDPLKQTTDNQFSEEDDMEYVEEQPTRKTKTVPIVINLKPLQPKQVNTLMNEIKNISKATTLKYAAEAITVHTSETTDYTTTLNHLKAKRYSYHTYTQKDQKDKKFVIKGLPKLPVEHITESLIAQNIMPKKISLMKKPKDKPNQPPLYFMSLNSEADVAAVYKVKAVCSIIIKWERYHNPKKGTQCYNCQCYGHGTVNCFNPSRCVKCAGSHKTEECKKTSGEPPKCANYGKDHPANYSQCEVYLDYLKNNENRRQKSTTKKTQQRRIPEPPTLEEQNFPRLFSKNVSNTNIQQSTEFHPAATTSNISNNSKFNLSYSNISQTKDKITNGMTDLNDLLHELNILNSLCDIKFMITALRQLNSKLKN